VVPCGTAPDYIKGDTVTIETTTMTNLQLAEVRVVGTDDSQDALTRALKENAGASCTKRRFNSCYNDLALARHNDYREGHENEEGKAFTLTGLLVINEPNAVALQAQMDKSDFAGESSITNIPQGCQMSFYTETNTAAVPDLDKNHAVTDSWYSGYKHYDYTNGKWKDGLTAAEKTLAKAFTRMVWRGTKTVAFGVKGKYVAAWYCNPSGSTNSNGAGDTEGSAAYLAAFKANVMKSCLELTVPAAGPV